ncbi:RnfABCDGE type electron transport complex subunit G [Plebeiibacterium marinum]|uniref:Ion-translocating oxidoreductase complex subunit G n=1 Tax=Plebeiibacterium marinum TaxID=2992111 RepID=A0AAE3MDS6_9BACT|nr:RnfABCDGE type electron transport complex subunit G [Plebeiobacterium marinum]MCW3805591.1 RnfABCDGE type electron transport complex subunit G [Plebeiobacterium marinum]
MAKTESTLVNMVLALLIITAVAGGSLGMVYKVTKEPIAAAKLAKQKKAIEQVVPGFDNNPTDEAYELTSKEGFALKVFPCKKGEELLGVAISTKTEKGFSGEIKVMVGMKPDGTIINYSVLEHKETPGLGSKMQAWFRMDKGNQSVLGKNPKTTKMVVSKDGGQVDAITAATISSRAFLDAIMVAYNTYMDNTDAHSSATTKSKGGQS